MAGIELNNIIQQAATDMRKYSAQEISTQANFYLNKLRTIQDKLKIVEYSSTLEEFSALQSMGSEATATQINAADSQAVMKNKIMLDAYHVLSEIGSFVGDRDSTKYTIVVTTNIGVNEKIIWEELPFKDFANMIDFSGIGKYGYSASKLVLQDTDSLLSKYASNANNFGSERSWAYEKFDEAVRTLKTDGQGKLLTWKKTKKNKDTKFFKWQHVKRGNTLEAFLRYEQLKQNNPDWSEERLMYEAMQETMKKPAPFYQGGDIGDIQVKGDFATIAQNSTIEKMLNSTIRQLEGLIDVLKIEYSDPSINNIPIQSIDISAALEKKINELLQKFISNR